MRRLAIPVVAAFAVGGLVLLTGKTTGRPIPAPELPKRVLVGPPTTLATLRGRPAIINAWASWCEPCIKEAPQIARLASELHGRATLVGLDWSDSHAGAAAFVRQNHWRFPVLEDDAGTVGHRYGLTGLPATFVIDARGRIIKRLVGPQTAAGLLSTVTGRQLLQPRPLPRDGSRRRPRSLSLRLSAHFGSPHPDQWALDELAVPKPTAIRRYLREP